MRFDHFLHKIAQKIHLLQETLTQQLKHDIAEDYYSISYKMIIEHTATKFGLNLFNNSAIIIKI